ncbi:hypothetical protein F5Y16DRAFT_404773 [Xylariaceae sp. FL0255]|nr:hypothetical protein F5Y16DRAFT_404773 [Xylariaceae sp. FL0255]
MAYPPRYQRLLALKNEVDNRLMVCAESERSDDYLGERHSLIHDALPELATAENISAALQEVPIDSNNLDELTEWVFKHAPRLFLTLVMLTSDTTESLSHLRDWRDAGIDDTKLPLDVYSSKRSIRAFSLITGELWHVDIDDEAFMKSQSNFVLPTFISHSSFLHHLTIWEPLPFLPMISEQKADVAYHKTRNRDLDNRPDCKTYRAELHPAFVDQAHLAAQGIKLERGASQRFVVGLVQWAGTDRLDKRRPDTIGEQLKNINKFPQKVVSPHLHQPIAAYQRWVYGADVKRHVIKEHGVIFPWPTDGALDDCWEICDKGRNCLENRRWLLEEFIGITSALSILYDVGDGPKHLVWFKDGDGRGTLKVASIWLAAFQGEPGGDEKVAPFGRWRCNRFAIRYVVELVMWLLYGPEGVKTFIHSTLGFWMDLRYKTPMHFTDHMVKSLDLVDKQLNAGSIYKEILRLVRERTGISDVKDPPNLAKEICSGLQEIQDRYQEEADYLAPLSLKYSLFEVLWGRVLENRPRSTSEVDTL